ncbi:hypothetical protein [Aliikangiella coralliicola]|uniref:hypothetical protein n=1 Tax=Aliikangiella coralliicola TaxID=2592383 RepID=UPI00143D750F|nr:hypothetical protein [Aliikangiella coralliicola]
MPKNSLETEVALLKKDVEQQQEKIKELIQVVKVKLKDTLSTKIKKLISRKKR